MPAARSCVEALADALLDDVLELDHAEHARALGRPRAASRPPRAIAVDLLGEVGGQRAAALLDVARDGVGRALAELAAVEVDAAHARLGRERR